MNISIWHEAQLVTMDGANDYAIITDGAMVIENAKIIWIGKESDLPEEYTKQAQFHSAKGRFITPGLIDCHTHLVYAKNRVAEFEQRLKGVKTHGGILTTVQATRAATFAELYEGAAKRLQSMIEGGVTTLEIKSGYGLNLESERKMLQVAKALSENYPVDIQTTFLGAHVLPAEFKSNQQYIQYLISDVLPLLIQEGLVEAIDGFCEKGAFSAEDLAPLFELAQRHQLPIKIHAEQLSLGAGPTLAAQYKALSADHLEFLDEMGVKMLQQAGAVAVLLPGAYYFLQQTQKPPIDLLRQYGVPMALATDANPGTSPTTSLLLMMNMGCLLFGLTPFEALQAVTFHAAKALKMEQHKGKLALGFDADFAVWDITSPSELCYHFGECCCESVIKKGTVVYAR